MLGLREEVAEIRIHISLILKPILLCITRSLYVCVTLFMYLFLAVLGLPRCGVFSLGEQGLLSSCGTRASRCSGFFCCGARVLEHTDFSGCGSWTLEHRLSTGGA